MSSTFHQPLPQGRKKADLDVFYDADCGFCTRTALMLRKLDRAHRLRLVELQRALDVASDAPSEDQLLQEMHARDASGRWFMGGAAWLQIAHVVPLMKPLAFVAELPLIRSLVEPTYAVIARNRHRISRLMGDGDCSLSRHRA